MSRRSIAFRTGTPPAGTMAVLRVEYQPDNPAWVVARWRGGWEIAPGQFLDTSKVAAYAPLGVEHEAEYAQRRLDEPCPFCRQRGAELWHDPADNWKPYQVRCRLCDARGPRCDCGEASAVPSWLGRE